MRYYAGIGSRSTPPEVLEYMRGLATWLGSVGYVLRSGGCFGADQAFEQGAQAKEIFKAFDSTPAAEEEASMLHPNPAALTGYARRLHGRSVNIIRGRDLDKPVDFVVCWTPCAQKTGGTRTGIVCAECLGIPVFNLADPADVTKLGECLRRLLEAFSRQ